MGGCTKGPLPCLRSRPFRLSRPVSVGHTCPRDFVSVRDDPGAATAKTPPALPGKHVIFECRANGTRCAYQPVRGAKHSYPAAFGEPFSLERPDLSLPPRKTEGWRIQTPCQMRTMVSHTRVVRSPEMPETVESQVEQEPMGIVISRGTRTEATPRFWAYVWGEEEKPRTTPTPVATSVK